MRVLLISQFYPPEMEPSGYMCEALVEELEKAGHVVDVVSGFANFPAGKFLDRKAFEIFRSVGKGCVTRHQVWVFPSDNANNLKRIANYMSFMLFSFLRCLTLPRPDIVFVTSPPLFAAISGALAAKLRNIPMVLDIRDIWPESAVQMGNLKSKLLIRIFEKIERALYDTAVAITVATPRSANVIRERTADQAKAIEFVPCGVHVPETPSVKTQNPFRPEDQNRFKVLYAGLHGYAQGLETLLAVAERFLSLEEIVFYLVGDGPDKARLSNIVTRKKLKNVRLVAPVPKHEIGDYYTHTDCAVVPLIDIPVFKAVFPSKTFDLLSWGVPIIVAVGGEIGEFVESQGVALSVPPCDVEAYCEALLALKADGELRRRLKVKGRALAEEIFSYDVVNRKFLKIIMNGRDE